jgi:hypothetical protein
MFVGPIKPARNFDTHFTHKYHVVALQSAWLCCLVSLPPWRVAYLPTFIINTDTTVQNMNLLMLNPRMSLHTDALSEIQIIHVYLLCTCQARGVLVGWKGTKGRLGTCHEKKYRKVESRLSLSMER